MGKRIILATWGSFGDLHPFLALALGLRARGHEPVLAVDPVYREKVEGEGIPLLPMRPVLPPDDTAEIVRRAMEPKTGSEMVIRELLMPYVREQYEDLMAAARGADLLINHPIVYTGPLVAEKLGLPWANAILQPMLMASAHEPMVPPSNPGLAVLHRLGPSVGRLIMGAARRMVQDWTGPIHALRAELGLKPGRCPILIDHFSPYLNLALFSRALGEPQPDWPAHTVQCGFPFYDRLAPGVGMPEELERFLDAGPPPVVFTLGSSAVFAAGDFYRDSIEACRRLGRRAVLLVGTSGLNELPDLPGGMIAIPYAPHSELFPRAAAVVHQGGVGTTGQALRAGKPTLIVPHAHDQPDSAIRLARRGAARWIPQPRYSAVRAERELRLLLTRPHYAERAEQVARIVRAETGVTTGCDAVERLLLTHSPA